MLIQSQEETHELLYIDLTPYKYKISNEKKYFLVLGESIFERKSVVLDLRCSVREDYSQVRKETRPYIKTPSVFRYIISTLSNENLCTKEFRKSIIKPHTTRLGCFFE